MKNDGTTVGTETNTTQVLPIQNLNWKQLKEEEDKVRVSEFMEKLKELQKHYGIEIEPQLTISAKGTKSQLLFRVID